MVLNFDVIRSLRLTVNARGSSEVSTDFVRQKDGPSQYRVVRETNGRLVLKFYTDHKIRGWKIS